MIGLLLGGCGAMGSSKFASAPREVAAEPGGGGAAAPASPSAAPPAVADGDAGSAAKIATDVPAPRPEPGQLTAGVWDDNLNFEFFRPYATRMAQVHGDLAAFQLDDQRRANAELAQRAMAHQELDIQLVVDTTGSMGDELQYLQSEFDSIAKQIRTKFPRVTPRWSLVVYRDQGDAYVAQYQKFTTDTEKFRHNLRQQSAGGGGDFPEAVIVGLETALQQEWRGASNVARVIFWVADAPPHPGEGGRLAALAKRAQKLGVHIYPVASSGIDDATEYQMRATAQMTGGRYLFLTDDSGIGNSHLEPHIPCYQVTRLDHAVVRMVESEMSGRRASPSQEQVLRVVGQPNAEGKCTVGETMVVAF